MVYLTRRFGLVGGRRKRSPRRYFLGPRLRGDDGALHWESAGFRVATLIPSSRVGGDPGISVLGTGGRGRAAWVLPVRQWRSFALSTCWVPRGHSHTVVPAKAGIQESRSILGCGRIVGVAWVHRLCGNDGALQWAFAGFRLGGNDGAGFLFPSSPRRRGSMRWRGVAGGQVFRPP